ncbi:MAG: hypothetical protein PHQ91_15055 [Thermoanaerobaculaceae bacterium]|nr:hypothetical protein [Thermoanaerobaculaceae bacterium]
MKITPALTRDIGQAERALRALLEVQLVEAGLSFPGWTVLVFLDGAGSLTRAELIGRQLAGHVAPDAAMARSALDDLLSAGLLAPAGDGGAEVDGGDARLAATAAGEAVFRRVRQAVAGITGELYGDLPAADLEATQRTLAVIARRAEARLVARRG